MQAIIFDFDGLILDTETPDYQSWQETYDSFGVELSLPVWQDSIGSVDLFNPYTYLEQLLGKPIDRVAVHAARKRRDNELLAQQTVLPGVIDYLHSAQALGLKVGIASSSTHSWVDGHLARLGLTEQFAVIRCRDDVDNRGKPDPAVYLAAVEALGVAPDQALALEDSPHGATAAIAAGLYCVAVTNNMTASLAFPPVARRLSSLAQMPLIQLIQEVEGG